mgnify:FL=1
MKKCKRILIGLLASLLMVVWSTGAVGCNKKDDSPETLEIYIEKMGYGVDWLDDIIEAFKQEQWVKDKYPNLNIPKPEARVNQGSATQRVIAGAKSNTADLLFGTTTATGWIYRSDEESSNFEELSDVYNSEVPGETGVIFKEKMLPSIRSWVEQPDLSKADTDPDAKVYHVFPWINGYIGMLYNKDNLDKLLGKDNYTMPRTTDEWMEMVRSIIKVQKDKGLDNTDDAFINPFIYAPVMYWGASVSTWWAQYETRSGYEKYFLGSARINGRDQLSPKVLEQKGKLRSFQTIESFVGAPGIDGEAGTEEIYDKVDEDSFKAQNTFDRIQVKYINGQGVFMPNGDWFDLEMRNAVEAGKGSDITYMQLPIISAVSEKLSYYKAGDTVFDKNADGTTKEGDATRKVYDELLRKLVDHVDGKCDKDEVEALYTAKGKSIDRLDADIAHIHEARHLMAPVEGHEAFIPSYATAKDVAKDFLRFMATDKAIRIFAESTKGCSTAFSYDVIAQNPDLYDTFTDIQKQRLSMVQNGGISMPVKASYRLAMLGGLDMSRYPSGSIEVNFSSESGRKTAEEMVNYDINYYTQNNNAQWNSMLTAAGMR